MIPMVSLLFPAWVQPFRARAGFHREGEEPGQGVPPPQLSHWVCASGWLCLPLKATVPAFAAFLSLCHRGWTALVVSLLPPQT